VVLGSIAMSVSIHLGGEVGTVHGQAQGSGLALQQCCGVFGVGFDL